MTIEAEKRGSTEAQAAVAHARMVVAELERGIEVDISHYETMENEPPGAILDRLREKVAEEIAELQRVLRN
jgi:hypothetical protein